MAVSESAAVEIESRSQLADYFESGCKVPSGWRIGLEHEKILFRRSDLRPAEYERGHHPLLNLLLEDWGWQDSRRWRAHSEGGFLIGLEDDHKASVTLEPGGQIELSGSPQLDMHLVCREFRAHQERLGVMNARLGLGSMSVGFQPLWTKAQSPWMPKRRYVLMRPYMASCGRLGVEMMQRSATVQANFDYSSESDMVVKMRVATALQPIVTAMFANSPYCEGRLSGYLSYRSHCWHHVDPARSGLPLFVFEDGFGFERWVDYLLSVPMYALVRGDEYVDARLGLFGDFMAGRVESLRGHRALLSDWDYHVAVAFPEARLKRFIEMRGADSGPWCHVCSLPALWTGLLYDGVALGEAEALAYELGVERLEAGILAEELDSLARLGLGGRLCGRLARDWALDVLSIAERGLASRACLADGVVGGEDERVFLRPVQAMVDEGITPAELLLRRYGGDARGVYSDPEFADVPLEPSSLEPQAESVL